MTDDKPEMSVATEDVHIHVHDRKTATLALEVIDDVLTEYIGETSHVERDPLSSETKVRYQATCPECGNSWERFAENDLRATCPVCNHSWGHDTPGRERPDAEVVSQ